MIKIDKEQLDRVAERNSLDRKTGKLGSLAGKAFIPIIAAEAFLAFALAPKLNILLCILIIAIADIVLVIAVLFIIILADTTAKMVRNSGSFQDMLRVMSSTKKMKNFYSLLHREICSDRTLAEADQLVRTADRKKYAYLSALAMKACCLDLRCQSDEAEQVIAEIKTLPEKRIIERNDHMFALLDHYSNTRNDQKYLETISEYSDVLASFPERCGTNSSLSAFLTIAAHEAFILKRYDLAVIYCDYALEYRFKDKDTQQKSNTNLKVYNTAAIHLSKSAALMKNGNADEARSELETAEKLAASLTCGIPPVFLREWDYAASHLTNQD